MVIYLGPNSFGVPAGLLDNDRLGRALDTLAPVAGTGDVLVSQRCRSRSWSRVFSCRRCRIWVLTVRHGVANGAESRLPWWRNNTGVTDDPPKPESVDGPVTWSACEQRKCLLNWDN